MKRKTNHLQGKTIKKNLTPKNNIEKYLKRLGFEKLIGIDEVGRGAWAGPLVACAVQLPQDVSFKKLRDSKLLSYLTRESLARELKKRCQFALGIVEVLEINEFGLSWANKTAFERAIKQFPGQVDLTLIDGLKMKSFGYPYKAIVDGDRLCASIAAASVIAKDFRDKMMIRLAAKYDKWGFDLHKGYGTKLHRERLEKYGISEIHRAGFKPILNLKLNRDF